MIRIVGVQRGETAGQEFIVLQNQGAMRVLLRGHVLMTEGKIAGIDPQGFYAFPDEEFIGPGAFVVLGTGVGRSRWCAMEDGRYALRAFMGASEPRWNLCFEPIHILNVQHSYAERKLAPVLVGS